MEIGKNSALCRKWFVQGKYKDCKKQIDILTKKVEIAKETLKGKTKTVDKKIKQQETDLKTLNAEMMKVKIEFNLRLEWLQLL